MQDRPQVCASVLSTGCSNKFPYDRYCISESGSISVVSLPLNSAKQGSNLRRIATFFYRASASMERDKHTYTICNDYGKFLVRNVVEGGQPF